MDTVEDTAALQTSRIEYCSVCGDQADGYHYGVLSCRGCNAFFRRSVTYNLEFHCRRGGNCVIDRNARCACRACRLDKCEMVGMDRSAVQVSHEKNRCKPSIGRKMNTSFFENRTDHDANVNDIGIGIGIARTTTQPVLAGGNTSLASPTDSSASQQSSPYGDFNSRAKRENSSSGDCVRSPGLLFTAVGQSNNRTSLSPNLIYNGRYNISLPTVTYPTFVFESASAIAAIPPTFLLSPTTEPTGSATAFFTRLIEEYFDQRRRRRSMLCVTLEDVLNDSTDISDGTLACLEDINAIYRVQMILMFEWVEKLPEFQQLLNAHDKIRLLRAFSLKYLVLDNVLYTLEHGQLDRLLLVNNNFIRPGFMPSAVQACMSLEQHRAYTLMYGEYAFKIIEDLLKPMAQLNITFAEIMFLRLLLLWNPGSVELTPQSEELVKKASERALQQLHIHFTTDQSIDLKNRLGVLLLFLSPLTKHTQNLADITTLISNFGILPEWDSFMNDLLRD